MSRSLLRLVCVAAGLAGPAFAQNNGVWTGYVRGWVNDSPPPAVPRYGIDGYGPPRVTLTPAGAAVVAQSYYAQQLYNEQLLLTQRQAAEREARREAEREAAAQAALEARRQVIQEQARLLEQQWLAARQEALQQQKLAAATQEAAAAQVAAAQALAAQQLAAATAEREREEKEREARRQAELAAKPREKGPDIYRWVDDDGVVHLSTKPPVRSR